MHVQPCHLIRLVALAALTAAVGCQDPQHVATAAFQLGAPPVTATSTATTAAAATTAPPAIAIASPAPVEAAAPVGSVLIDLEAAALDAPVQRRVLVTAAVNVEVVITAGGKVFKKGYPGHWITRERHAFSFDGLPVGEGKMEVFVYVGLTPHKVYDRPLDIRTGPAMAIDLFVNQSLLAGNAYRSGMIMALPRGAAIAASPSPAPSPSPTPMAASPSAAPSAHGATPAVIRTQ